MCKSFIINSRLSEDKRLTRFPSLVSLLLSLHVSLDTIRAKGVADAVDRELLLLLLTRSLVPEEHFSRFK